jgi:purine-binding chemotaxis protein CheW
MSEAGTMTSPAERAGGRAGRFTEYVTVTVGEQVFGLPIERVHDVFVPERMTVVPQAPVEIVGILNLRGRIVTALDLRVRLDLLHGTGERATMAVGIDHAGESYGLLVDAVGEVVRLPDDTLERNPVNLELRLAAISLGVHRLEGQLLVALDIDRVLDIGGKAAAA